jgi:hypothetical protein
MIQREGRLASVQVGSEGRTKSPPPRTIVIRSWERPVFVAALIGALVLGGIAALRSLVGLIP